MLVKEYRICLPMSVEEYRIAQLYMIQKKSREESSGAGSGVEILTNEPYDNGPGGSGQYTHKVYHIGSHLPGWFRAILPKSALMVEEEAWNAYPYTRTIYRCPFIEKFTLYIETRYLNDGGQVDNVFELGNSDLRARTVDYIDIVKDPISSGDYYKEEDPKLYVSEKTGRGPLNDNWRKDYIKAMNGPNPEKKAIMCAYKLCKVEFRYWGMQSKIERFIHDIGLRKTMVRAHRQAWAWQDEYHGLTMADIRELERHTQEALRQKMEAVLREQGEVPASATVAAIPAKNSSQQADDLGSQSNVSIATLTSSSIHDDLHVVGTTTKHLDNNTNRAEYSGNVQNMDNGVIKRDKDMSRSRPLSKMGSTHRESMHKSMVIDGDPLKSIGSLEMLCSSEDEEFFDAIDGTEAESAGSLLNTDAKLSRSSSLDYLAGAGCSSQIDEPDGVASFMSSGPVRADHYAVNSAHSSHTAGDCKTSLLFLVIHGGSVLESGQEMHLSKHTDLSSLKATFRSHIIAHYPSLQERVAFRLVSCPFVCASTLNLLASLYPGNFDSYANTPAVDVPLVAQDNVPLSAIPLFATGCHEYADAVLATITKLNTVYAEFLNSEEGRGFNGQICLVSDSIGSIIAYDALCKNNPYVSAATVSYHGSNDALHETDQSDDAASRVNSLEPIKQVSLSNPDLTITEATPNKNRDTKGAEVTNREPALTQSHRSQSSSPSNAMTYRQAASCPPSRRTSQGSQSDNSCKLSFEVTDLFMFGTPLALVLAYRKVAVSPEYKNTPTPQFLDPFSALIDSHLNATKTAPLPKPSCQHIYNLFYPTDPSAHRLEPIILDKFRHISPVKIPRYAKFPLGDGSPLHVVETIQSNLAMFRDSAPPSPRGEADSARMYERRVSNMSVSSQWSGHWDPDIANLTQLTNRWWGTKRVDYALYSPEAVINLPQNAVPYLLHSSFWESKDAAAFILRQVVRQDLVERGDVLGASGVFTPSQPRERWQRRRTTMKLRNLAPNHRANDVVVLEDKEQVISAKFMYGPLDMVSLNGEKVDIHVMRNPPSGEWTYHGTEHTDSAGRLNFTFPAERRLAQGMYPVKLVVRGDHTSADLYLAVLPAKTEAVVFSIDGSFTASVSIMGSDPKVRPAAVDCVRHWQELGYMLLYVTARPDMQHKKVIAWLAQHNFPHGMVAFMDGLSAEPINQKLQFLRHVKQEADIKIKAAYGSAKDIWVYRQLDLKPEQIFVVGKASKKQYKEAIVLSGGYASHLEDMMRSGNVRAATGNARFFLRKSCFSLPNQMKLKPSKKSVRKTLSMPGRGGGVAEPTHLGVAMSESGNTVLDPRCASAGAAKSRGASPRPKITITTRQDTHR